MNLDANAASMELRCTPSHLASQIMSTPRFIDAHHHLWDLDACHYPWLMAKGQKRFFGDPTAIQKNYLANDFAGESATFHPEKSVHIQVGVADKDIVKESEWLQGQPSFPNAIVAFADLSSSDVEQQIAAQLQFSKLRGIRQIIGRHIEEDQLHGSNTLIDNPNWLHGLRLLARHQLSFDLQMVPPQMPALLKTLKQVPELNVALCHCGSPWDQTRHGLENWRAGLRSLAELPNVSCKVSGLGMFNHDWTANELRPIVLDTIEIFGVERVMFGSNFPVDKLYRSYDDLWSAYFEITSAFSKQERERLFFDNAQQFYHI